MGYGLQTLANLPVVNDDFAVVMLDQSAGSGTDSLDLMTEIDSKLATLGAALSPAKTFPSVKRAIVISNDHATVPCYIRSRGSDTANRGIVIGAGESLFLGLVGSPTAGNELRYQCIAGTVSVAVYF